METNSQVTIFVLMIGVIGSILTTLIIRLKNINLCRCCCFHCQQQVPVGGSNLANEQIIMPADIIASTVSNNIIPANTPISISKANILARTAQRPFTLQMPTFTPSPAIPELPQDPVIASSSQDRPQTPRQAPASDPPV